MSKLSESKWVRDREVAHWILQKLVKDNLEKVSPDYLVLPDGRFEIERSGTSMVFDTSRLSIEYLNKQNVYSKDEIRSGLNFLMIKKYIQYADRPIDVGQKYTLVESTLDGLNAYHSQELLLEIEEREANWPKRNWIKYDLLKFIAGVIIGLVIGYYFRKLTEQPTTLQQDQKQTSRLLPKSPDIVHRSHCYVSLL